ncbi:hypothetical protein F5Y09DRAFT_304268 [Xylaria sp. FL1042]|nr:hypothetical protein F5Y09DRAFT_304268 [Xylaria sp. FL1042]
MLGQHTEIVGVLGTYWSEMGDTENIVSLATSDESLLTAGVVLNVRRLGVIFKSLEKLQVQMAKITSELHEPRDQLQRRSIEPNQLLKLQVATRLLMKGSTVPDELAKIMRRLDRAKRDLKTQIQIANVGLYMSSEGKLEFSTEEFKDVQTKVVEKLGENNGLTCARHMEYLGGRQPEC